MGSSPLRVLGIGVVLALVTVATGSVRAQPGSPGAMLIAGGTLIDGSGRTPSPNQAILLDGGRIVALGADAEKQATKGVQRIDAAGKWILPGLIDAHIHLFQSGGLDARPDVVPAPLPPGRTYNDVVTDIQKHPEPYLQAYLCSGITSVVDPGGPRWEFVLRYRAEHDPRLPRMAFSGPLLMTGGAAGRPAGPAPLNLQDEAFWGIPDEATARQQVERLAGYRPDLVKIVFMTRDAEDLAAKTKVVRAAVAASHAAGLRVAVHATTLDTAMASVEAGADMLVHSVADQDISDAFVNAVVSRRVMVSPTLLVGQMYREALSGAVNIEPFERQCAPATTVKSFDVLPSLNIRRERSDDSTTQKRNLKRLADAGAIIYVGSDAGNTRTLHGPSLHREFVMMAAAGLTPMSILVAATRTNARVMGREKELGQIAPGMLADILILDANPLVDIRNTRRIFKVIRGGIVYGP